MTVQIIPDTTPEILENASLSTVISYMMDCGFSRKAYGYPQTPWTSADVEKTMDLSKPTFIKAKNGEQVNQHSVNKIISFFLKSVIDDPRYQVWSAKIQQSSKMVVSSSDSVADGETTARELATAQVDGHANQRNTQRPNGVPPSGGPV